MGSFIKVHEVLASEHAHQEQLDCDRRLHQQSSLLVGLAATLRFDVQPVREIEKHRRIAWFTKLEETFQVLGSKTNLWQLGLRT